MTCRLGVFGYFGQLRLVIALWVFLARGRSTSFCRSAWMASRFSTAPSVAVKIQLYFSQALENLSSAATFLASAFLCWMSGARSLPTGGTATPSAPFFLRRFFLWPDSSSSPGFSSAFFFAFFLVGVPVGDHKSSRSSVAFPVIL